MKVLRIQYLRMATFSSFSFLICHVYNLLHLIYKGLTLTLQNEVTLNLNAGQNPILTKTCCIANKMIESHSFQNKIRQIPHDSMQNNRCKVEGRAIQLSGVKFNLMPMKSEAFFTVRDQVGISKNCKTMFSDTLMQCRCISYVHFHSQYYF